MTESIHSRVEQQDEEHVVEIGLSDRMRRCRIRTAKSTWSNEGGLVRPRKTKTDRKTVRAVTDFVKTPSWWSVVKIVPTRTHTQNRI